MGLLLGPVMAVGFLIGGLAGVAQSAGIVFVTSILSLGLLRKKIVYFLIWCITSFILGISLYYLIPDPWFSFECSFNQTGSFVGAFNEALSFTYLVTSIFGYAFIVNSLWIPILKIKQKNL